MSSPSRVRVPDAPLITRQACRHAIAPELVAARHVEGLMTAGICARPPLRCRMRSPERSLKRMCRSSNSFVNKRPASPVTSPLCVRAGAEAICIAVAISSGACGTRAAAGACGARDSHAQVRRRTSLSLTFD